MTSHLLVTCSTKLHNEVSSFGTLLFVLTPKPSQLNDAISLFKNMLRTEIRPDNFTYACIIRACSESFDLEGLRLVHGMVVSGLGLDSVTSSALVTAYSNLSLIDDASKVFIELAALELDATRREKARWVYFGWVDLGFKGIEIVTYRPRNSWILFAKVPDLVTWSALITGYSQYGDYEKALYYFRKMHIEGKKADPVLIASVLVAAAQSTNVWSGSVVHGYVIQRGFELSVVVSSALTDMYSKCGFVDLGIHVFETMRERNIVTYNTVIRGLALHGFASQAFKMFEEIIAEGLKPDESTFAALLCACCHCGLVNNGLEIFRQMMEDFRIQARTEHYVYIVKLLGTVGNLEEAYNFILSLPKPVDSGIWGALLSCCDVHQNSELAEIGAQLLFKNDPNKGAYRVMLSNIYASNGRMG
ncbi:hypothetical protein Patl1_18110 [Pistacia atlantica]|uniref:Uncharacterized protein n=1 Tax=Pistacia atlantica TaxID=434234 RepID=A0ACC1BXN9_9ROSI|nr:hypothetical protein Patl1_18110 [Pistacia atlantica]